MFSYYSFFLIYEYTAYQNIIFADVILILALIPGLELVRLSIYRLFKGRNIFSGDLIIAKMGDPVAKCTIIPNNLSRCLMSSDGIRLKVNEKLFDKSFIEFSINSPYFRKSTYKISTGTTRQRIGLQEFRNLVIACPPITEQVKI